MALLSAQQITLAGLNPVMQAAAAGGDTFVPGSTRFLRVTNGSGAGVTVTIDSVTPSNYGGDENVAVVVPAGGTREIGPLPDQRFGPSGVGSITYSAAASVTVGVFFI